MNSLFTLSVKPGMRKTSQKQTPNVTLRIMLTSENPMANSGGYGAVLIEAGLYQRSEISYRGFITYIRGLVIIHINGQFLQLVLIANKMLVVHRAVKIYNVITLSFF